MATQLLDQSALNSAAEDLFFNKAFSLELPSVKSSFSLEKATADGLTMQTAIGQGDTLASPVHMAMIAGAIANGGTMMEPSFVDQIENHTGTIVKEMSPKSLGRVMTAEEAYELTVLMKSVVQRGTASMLADLPYDIAGKTGTAEYGTAENGGSHSWFVGFSNTGNSDIVVAVIVEGEGAGGSALPVARSIFQTYFG